MKKKSHSSVFFFFFRFIIAFTIIQFCTADCDNLQDTCPASPPTKEAIFINGLPCENPTNKSGHDFKSMELSKPGTRDASGSSNKIVTATKFPGLNTLGLSIGRSDIEVDGLVNLHNHPRATEMIFVREGVLVAVFLDTKNTPFQKLLKAGDVFVIPKGLFHFFLNRGAQVATLFSVFNSQNPGLESLASVPSDATLESVENIKTKLISLFDSQVDGVHDFSSAVLDIFYG
ncbi:hypothetical protein VNO77_09929 [Canavalia gladiata]|uniref:Germin-like protein n=1 Tax=Canavalia gladiata TaxID=3824 RepID=A0AAN9MAF1_CANGL